MTSLKRVAELNNSGASMLVAARDKDAFRTLKTALAIMEQAMQAAPEKSEATDSSSSSRTSTSSNGGSDGTRSSSSAATENAASEDMATTDDSSAARFHIDTECSTEIPELKDDRYFIFNQALLVATKDQAASISPSSEGSTSGTGNTAAIDDPPQPYSQSLVCFYTSVVVYNLALAYHKRGMTAATAASSPSSPPPTNTTNSNTTAATAQAPPRCPAKDSRLALAQSLRLYEHCLKIIRSIANYSEDCKMLLYAVSCNLAHLYCRKGDRTRAQALLDNLEEAKRWSFQNLI